MLVVCWSWLINVRVESRLKIHICVHTITHIQYTMYRIPNFYHFITLKAPLNVVEYDGGWLVVVNQCQSRVQTEDTHTSGNSIETHWLLISSVVRS